MMDHLARSRGLISNQVAMDVKYPDGLLFQDLGDLPNPSQEKLALVKWCCATLRLQLVGGLEGLPYTDRFERLFDEARALHPAGLDHFQLSKRAPSPMNAFWLVLLGCRKSGLLAIESPNPNRRPFRRPDENRRRIPSQIVRIVAEKAGLPKSRAELEALPYTAEFHRLHGNLVFLNGAVCTLSLPDFWVVIARIMKKSRPKLEDGQGSLFRDHLAL